MESAITIVTADAYEQPARLDAYHLQVLLEDAYLAEALEQRGLRVESVSWSNPTYNWDGCGALVIRSPWDYLERLDAFKHWLRDRSGRVRMFNSYETMSWNLDKRYLIDLQSRGMRTVKTVVLETTDSLDRVLDREDWHDAVLKPAVSAGGHHTFRVNRKNCAEIQPTFERLALEEDFILQPFLSSIEDEGELSLMVIDGRYTHAVRKRAKAGDFRVQDDHGGTVEPYHADASEAELAASIVASIDPLPVYARVDLVRDNDGVLAISELELIEPELFFRFNRRAAHSLADAIVAQL